MSKLAHLPARAVLSVEGEDRLSFLQGLVSNDVALATEGKAVWAALLTPQGKYLADFFILVDGNRLLLDCERAQAAMLATKLSRFRLRARVTVAETDLQVTAAWNGAPGPAPGLLVVPDPRLPDAGWRIVGASLPDADASEEDYDRHRLLLGLPDGTRDNEPDRTVLLEAGFDELGGISWTKGCYMGQELTARTRYRGLLKRRLVPVSGSALPPPGTPLLRDGREIGTMRSSRDDVGLAVLRLEHLHGALETEHGILQARVPDWMRLPGSDAADGAGASPHASADPAPGAAAGGMSDTAPGSAPGAASGAAAGTARDTMPRAASDMAPGAPPDAELDTEADPASGDAAGTAADPSSETGANSGSVTSPVGQSAASPDRVADTSPRTVPGAGS